MKEFHRDDELRSIFEIHGETRLPTSDTGRLGEVDLTAIDMGHDLKRYYRGAVAFVDAEQLGGVMLDKLAEQCAEEAPSGTPRRKLPESAKPSGAVSRRRNPPRGCGAEPWASYKSGEMHQAVPPYAAGGRAASALFAAERFMVRSWQLRRSRVWSAMSLSIAGFRMPFSPEINDQNERHRRPVAEPALTITKNGLAFGDRILARMGRGDDGRPKLAIDGAEDRILALLAAVYGKAVRACVLDNIRRASTYWCQGEPVLAEIELALAGLPPLADPAAARRRLDLAETLLAAGLSGRDLIKACGLDPSRFDLMRAGYNPAQPRVPAGNPTGGRWADGGAAGGAGYGSSAPPRDEPPSAAGGVGGHRAVDGSSTSPQGEPPNSSEAISVAYKPAKGPPKDPAVVVAPDGTTITGGDPPVQLLAPRHADYRQIYAAGQAIASLPPFQQILHIRTALRQGGTYDFQRDPITQETQSAYANASNYAVGVYLAGAGYSLSGTQALAEVYAFFYSRNFGNKNQLAWIKQGWRDPTAGRWK